MELLRSCDVIIIGAGLLGCFAARAMARYDLDTLVLEQQEDVCTGISRSNTGIIYSGIDNKPGTLKAQLTVSACKGFDALAKELGFAFRRPGSLLLSFGDRGDEVLRFKLQRGIENGVSGARILTAEETLAMEPAAADCVTASLFVPDTGVVNPWEVGIAAYENAKQNGVRFCLGETVLHIERNGAGFRIETDKGLLQTKCILNCAGPACDAIREMTQTPLIRIFPTGADYLILDTTVGDRVRHVLFHEPEEKGKGLTVVPTVYGNLLIGPTERPDLPDMAAAPDGIEELLQLCSRVIPRVPPEVIRVFASERPNPFYVEQEKGTWVPQKKGISNFTILEEDGLFSFIGIKTPGLTCAESLGKYISGKTAAYLGCDRKNPHFDPVRRTDPAWENLSENGTRILSLSELSGDQRNQWILQHPEYGRIICRCRHISEGEVLDAIRRGAGTIDAVKRRAGTCMGRCQGGFCMDKILKLLARELQKNPAEISKDGAGSEILTGASVTHR